MNLVAWITSARVLPVGGMLLVKVTALLVLGWVAQAALARVNPRWRVLAWRVAAVGILALPVAFCVVPKVELAVAGPPPAAQAVVAQLPARVLASAPGAGPDDLAMGPVGAPAPPMTGADRAAPSPKNVSPREAASAGPAAPARAGMARRLMNRLLGSGASGASVAPRASAATVAAAAAAWALGIALLALRFCAGSAGLRALVRASRPVPEPIADLARRVTAGLRAPDVACRLSDRMAVPVLANWRRPVLLLPARMADDSYREELPAILAHEISHARSRDLFWMRVLTLLGTALWFHPLAWRMKCSHDDACEEVSDAVSAAYVGGAGSYSRTLARVAVEMAESAVPAAGIAMARVPEVTRRLARLRRRVFASSLSRSRVVLFVGVCAVLVGLLGAIRFTYAQAKADAARTYEATFGSGIRAAVLGVGEPGKGPNRTAWAADGTPLAGVPAGHEAGGSVSPGQNEVARKMYIEMKLASSGGEAVGIKWDVDGRGGSSGLNQSKDKIRMDLAVALPLGQKESVLDLGIAAGPWTTAVAGAPGGSSSRTQGGREIGVVFSDLYRKDGSTHLIVTHNIFEQDYRVVAFDAAGKAYPADRPNATGIAGVRQSDFDFHDTVAPEDVKRLEFQVRDYEWRKIPGIALQPSQLSARGTGQSPTVGLPEAVRQDITLPATVDVAPPEAGSQDHAITGKVVTADGRPAKNVMVFLGNCGVLTENHGTPTWKGGQGGPATVQTNDAGEFSFQPLREGSTDLWADDAQRGRGWVRDVKADAADVKIVLRPKEEQVTLRGTVVGPDGQPQAQAHLAMFADRENKQVLVAETRSDERGGFTLRGTPPVNPQSRVVYLRLVCVPKQGAAAWRLAPYVSADDLRIAIKPASSIQGRVVDIRAQPVAGARVVVHEGKDADYGQMYFTGAILRVLPSAVTDAEGRYDLGGIPLGCTMSVMAIHPDYVRGEAWELPIAAATHPAPAITLRDGVSFSGTVRHAETNLPAVGTTVTLQRFGEDSPVVTDAQGQYTVKATEYLIMDPSLRLSAVGPGVPPAWEGWLDIDKLPEPGDHVTGADIVVRKGQALRLKDWKEVPGSAPEPKVRLLAQTCDDGVVQTEGELAVCDGMGKELWKLRVSAPEGNTGIPRNFSWDPVDKTIWYLDEARNELSKIAGQDGKELWRKPYANDQEKPKQSWSMVTDAKTGNLWALMMEGDTYGNWIWIFGPSGDFVKQLEIPGGQTLEIAYSPHDDRFWLLGNKIAVIDREGKAVWEWTEETRGLFSNPTFRDSDGSVWIIDRSHARPSASRNRILILDASGKKTGEIGLPWRGLPCGMALDEKRQCVWIANYLTVLKLDLTGKTLAEIPLRGFSVSVEPETGCVWISAREGIYRVDPEGRFVWGEGAQPGRYKSVSIIPD